MAKVPVAKIIDGRWGSMLVWWGKGGGGVPSGVSRRLQVVRLPVSIKTRHQTLCEFQVGSETR